MPKPTPTATLVTRSTIVELAHAPAVREGHPDAESAGFIWPRQMVITTDYEGRPARLLSVTITATDAASRLGRWSSATRHPYYRIEALPEFLRSLVLTFEPDLHRVLEPARFADVTP